MYARRVLVIFLFIATEWLIEFNVELSFLV
jgi:hypothetical protein